jgi:hypothetical protein
MHRQKWIPILTAALAVQMVLLVIATTRTSEGSFRPAGPLLRFDAARVDEIRIDGPESHAVLRKVGERWKLPEHYDFPASAAAVGSLVERLAALEKERPVATTGSAAERFRVTESAFERRVQLFAQGDRVAELFVGSSPGFREVHTRESQSEEIYALELGAHEIPAKEEDWIDRGVLERDPDDLAQIAIGELVLTRQGTGADAAWVLADLAQDEEMVADETRALVDKVTRLRVDGVLGDVQGRRETPSADPRPLRITLTPREEQPVNYTFSRSENAADGYALVASDRAQVLKVAAAIVEPIQAVTREKLVRAASPDARPPAESRTGAEGAKKAAPAP